VMIARGMGWLVGRGVSVINMSFAGPENRLLAHAVGHALARQIAIVAAAGNDGPTAPPRYPAALPGVVAVTAVDERRRVYRRAASGQHIAFAAPGVNVWTAQARGRYGPSTGTSYATPFVTAVLAVSAREGRAEEPEAEDLGSDGPDAVFGRGLIRAPGGCAAAVTSGKPF
jgi:minor extracellular protease Epr